MPFFDQKNVPNAIVHPHGITFYPVFNGVFAAKSHYCRPLAATDLLNRYGLKQEITNDGFDVVYENFYETQVVTLGVSYKF